MKKIIALISALVLIFSLASCSDSTPKLGDVEPTPVEKAQTKIINGLGITIQDSRIVAHEDTNDYVKYVVVYYENGKKTDEVTHMFYTNENSFAAANEEMNGKSEVTQIDAEKRYISFWSGNAYYGTYAEDLELIKEDYIIK